MPIYEYQCKLCGHQLEAFQSINEAPLSLCPNCDKNGLNKLISNTSFQLKGSGWYKTDYEKKPKSNADTSATNADTKSAEGKTSDAKPAETKSAENSPASSEKLKTPSDKTSDSKTG